MKNILMVLVLFLLVGCATGEVNPKVVNTVNVSVSVYCESLHNFHRLLIRVIRVIDPEWTSICEVYFENKELENQEVELAVEE